MLNAVPKAVNNSARIVTLRHPNSQDATAYRKKVNRVDDPADTINDLPTIGGLGVLDSEDEADYTYDEIGDCKVLFTGAYAATEANWNRADTGLVYPEGTVEATIECILDPNDPNFFVPDVHDLVMVTPGGGFVLPYEIKGPTSNINIPPYTRKYILQPRNDLLNGI
jgi:hypothetical protein